MLPAGQGLQTRHQTGLELNDGLVVDDDLPVDERAFELAANAEPIRNLLTH